MDNTVIRIENLGKRYDIGANSADSLREQLTYMVNALFGRAPREEAHKEIWALKDINLTVIQGEILGVIGHNGAGKSTLLKVLSRITHPTTGRISMSGRVASLLEVGTGFHPELTGRENIFMNASVLGMKRAETRRKFDEIVDFAGVETFIDTPVKRYSSGMYMRLAFAVAAHLEPEILIVDEVLAVGDVAFQRKSLGKMSEVAKAGRTVIMVSHNIGAVSSLCTRAIHMSHGKIVKEGAVQSVVEDYIAANQGALQGECSWQPGEVSSERVELRSVRVINNGNVTADVDITHDVHVEIEYCVLKPGSTHSTGIHLFDGLGVAVLATANLPSANTQVDEWADRVLPVGRYRATCTIPANTLNDIRYRLTIVLATGELQADIVEESVIVITGHDSGEMRKEFTGNWLGVVRPKLPWQTEKLD